ncbi:RimK family protein [Bacteriovorax sp. BSW11_IV]|uniref:RimK family protein n=1 Tax=Bacteriovorax sp. BSW11_IV TaxID=1353529 RepID=UPI000554BD79|nr:RimK family protein [Bacteriovorax sp. BSW11_IV]
MKDLILIVDKKEDWQPFYSTDQVVTAEEYLFEAKYQIKEKFQVINLCHNVRYLSLGYYCSLLGEAKKHKIFPNIKTINDLSKKRFYLYDLEELQHAAEHLAKRKVGNDNHIKAIGFRIFFGQTKDQEFKSLAKQIFDAYPAPLLEVRIVHKGSWQIDSLVPFGIRDLTEVEEDFFAEALDRFSSKIWRLPKLRKIYRYDLAVLHDPEEKLPPSDPKALKLFQQACKAQGIYCEFITKKDLPRISEFDALFIRETTAINNHTYKFAKRAENEGLVVIDDTRSIIKCTNKIFLDNLLTGHNVPCIPSYFTSDADDETIDLLEKKFGFPMVMKIPDGSFSIGVTKVKDRKELQDNLKRILKQTALVLVQKFLYTSFDWRIGVLNGKPLFACKYYMSKDHWQIYNHAKKNNEVSGAADTLAIEDVPKHVMKSALDAANLIGNSLYGVDIKEVDGIAYVVEVNDNPNIDHDVEDRVGKKDIYATIVSEFIRRIEESKNN